MQNRTQFDRLNSRFDELVTERRGATDSTRQEIAENLFGRRDFTTERTKGQNRNAQIYDNTSQVSNTALSGAIHGLLTSPVGRWFKLRFEEPDLNDDSDAMKWVSEVEDRMHAAIAAPRANFHAQLSEVYSDLTGFGMGALFTDDVPGVGIQFSARPLQEIYVAEDPSGRIDTVGRQFKLTARQAVALWGKKAETASRVLERGNAEDRHDYRHLILPRDDHAVGNVDMSGMPWASFFISTEDSEIIDEGGFHELPFATPRWETDAGEVDGRGPGWNALSNQKMLNEMNRVSLMVGQLKAAPPRMVDSQAVLPGDLNFGPYAVIPVDTVMNSMNPPIQSLDVGGDFNISVALIEDTRTAIQNAFHHQLIQSIQDPRMTATQVLELSAQMQRHMAPILGRLQTELLEPVLDRVYAIESRAGRLPAPPEHIQNRKLRFDYVSPLGRAQQTADATAIINFTEYVKSVAEVSPEVLDIADFDEGTRRVGEAMAVPVAMIRDGIQVAQRRQAAAQLAAEQEQMQQAVTATDQIAKLSKAVPQQAA